MVLCRLNKNWGKVGKGESGNNDIEYVFSRGVVWKRHGDIGEVKFGCHPRVELIPQWGIKTIDFTM